MSREASRGRAVPRAASRGLSRGHAMLREASRATSRSLARPREASRESSRGVAQPCEASRGLARLLVALPRGLARHRVRTAGPLGAERRGCCSGVAVPVLCCRASAVQLRAPQPPRPRGDSGGQRPSRDVPRWPLARLADLAVDPHAALRGAAGLGPRRRGPRGPRRRRRVRRRPRLRRGGGARRAGRGLGHGRGPRQGLSQIGPASTPDRLHVILRSTPNRHSIDPRRWVQNAAT